jgi:hypothetical protein
MLFFISDKIAQYKSFIRCQKNLEEIIDCHWFGNSMEAWTFNWITKETLEMWVLQNEGKDSSTSVRNFLRIRLLVLNLEVSQSRDFIYKINHIFLYLKILDHASSWAKYLETSTFLALYKTLLLCKSIRNVLGVWSFNINFNVKDEILEECWFSCTNPLFSLLNCMYL